MSEARRARVLGIAAVFLLAAPLAILVVQAFAGSWRAPEIIPRDFGLRGFDIAFGTGQAGEALRNSLVVALAVTVASVVLAWPAARVLGQRRLPHLAFGLILLLLALPLLMPPYLAGFGLTEWFIRLGIDDSLFGLAIAHLIFALPYAVLILVSGFTRELEALEEMARANGLAAAQRLRLVTLPALRPALAAAALLSFLVSFSQYGSSLAIGAGRPTLPIVMLPFIGSDTEAAAALGLIFLVPCVLALALATRLQRSPL